MTFPRVCSISLLGCMAIVSTGLLATVLAQDQPVHSIASSGAASAPTLDYVNATAKALPIASYSDPQLKDDIENALNPPKPPSPEPKAPTIIAAKVSSLGTGTRSPSATDVGEPVHVPVITPPQPKAYGTANLPFSTARADLFKGGDMTRPDSYYPTNELFPYRAAGKLFFVEDGQSYVCSASLIDKGLVVTAAHCVTAWGKQTDYTGWQFIPGYRNGAAPYGKWSVRQAFVLDSYRTGDRNSCNTSNLGIVCSNDVAVLLLSPQLDQAGKPYYPGTLTGWYSYAVNEVGFTPTGITHITQLGYPVCLDNGAYMERNDTQGIVSPSFAKNSVMGSLMCGGSSGGPLIINFGIPSQLTGTTPGGGAQGNAVIGVTSWGTTDLGVKQMGASPFLTTNLPPLIHEACKVAPDAHDGTCP